MCGHLADIANRIQQRLQRDGITTTYSTLKCADLFDYMIDLDVVVVPETQIVSDAVKP